MFSKVFSGFQNILQDWTCDTTKLLKISSGYKKYLKEFQEISTKPKVFKIF